MTASFRGDDSAAFLEHGSTPLSYDYNRWFTYASWFVATLCFVVKLSSSSSCVYYDGPVEDQDKRNSPIDSFWYRARRSATARATNPIYCQTRLYGFELFLREELE